MEYDFGVALGYEVYNPHNRPLEELPVIYGFNNGGSKDFWYAQLITQEGLGIGSHVCSHEVYMPHDLGCIKGTRPDRHEGFREHYPEGYRMEFVGEKDIPTHKGLQEAIAKAKVLYETNSGVSNNGSI